MIYSFLPDCGTSFSKFVCVICQIRLRIAAFVSIIHDNHNVFSIFMKGLTFKPSVPLRQMHEKAEPVSCIQSFHNLSYHDGPEKTEGFACAPQNRPDVSRFPFHLFCIPQQTEVYCHVKRRNQPPAYFYPAGNRVPWHLQWYPQDNGNILKGLPPPDFQIWLLHCYKGTNPTGKVPYPFLKL